MSRIAKLDYDHITDIIYLRETHAKYKKSIQINPNLILDLNDENKVIGFEILNFSKDSGISKELLKTIVSWKVILNANSDTIKITINLVSKSRNKEQNSTYVTDTLGTSLIKESSFIVSA